MEGSAPAAELHQEQSQENNYQVITDNKEAELKKGRRENTPTLELKEEIEGEEEGCKTKQKCEEITLFGESGNQITSAMHEENLIKNGNYSVNKRLSSKGKVEVKEKGKG